MAKKKGKAVHSSKKKANGAMPVPKLSKPRDFTAEALKRLKVKPEQLATVPHISETYRIGEGGLKAALQAMRAYPEDDAIAAFLKKYDSLSVDDRRRAPWEAIAISAGLDVRTLSGAITNAIVLSGGNTSRILAYMAHRKMMEARIKYGQMPSGEKDRMALDIMVGALPSPKGPTFQINKVSFGMPNNQPQLGSGNPETIEAVAVDDGDDIEDRLFTHVNLDTKLMKIRQKELNL